MSFKIAVISANMGDFEKPVDNVGQSVDYDFYRFTDENFRPRFRSIYPRLQSRIPKMFGWQMVPDYDFYVWMDASYSFLNPDSVKWFVSQCDGVDFATFKHPCRDTIQEEVDYIKISIKAANSYIRSRFRNELMDEQLAEIKTDPNYVDDCLFAGGTFVYRNNETIHKMMKEWWYHTSRYHINDQLSLPYVVKKSGCKYNLIPSKYYDGPYRTRIREGTYNK